MKGKVANLLNNVFPFFTAHFSSLQNVDYPRNFDHRNISQEAEGKIEASLAINKLLTHREEQAMWVLGSLYSTKWNK